MIEMLIVVVIIGMLAALVGPRLFSQERKARQKTAKGQIALFETALDTYRLDMGRYPTRDQGLQALRERPAGTEEWDGPYLRKPVPKDPWGNPYFYESPSEHGDYAIISYGADGRPGGDNMNKDIVSWEDTDS